MTLTEQSPEMLEGIIEEPFPHHPPSPWPLFVVQPGIETGNEERVAYEELARISKSLSVGKAPVPDRVPNLALKVATAEAPGLFRSAVQKCLNEGVFRDLEAAEPDTIAKGGVATRKPVGIQTYMLFRYDGECA